MLVVSVYFSVMGVGMGITLLLDQITALRANYHRIGDSLESKAVVRLYDDLSGTEVYLYALDDDDVLYTMIVTSKGVQLYQHLLHELDFYNNNGEYFKNDFSFVPLKAQVIYQKMRKDDE